MNRLNNTRDKVFGLSEVGGDHNRAMALTAMVRKVVKTLAGICQGICHLAPDLDTPDELPDIPNLRKHRSGERFAKKENNPGLLNLLPFNVSSASRD